MDGYRLASLVIFLLQLGAAAYGNVGTPLPPFCLGSRGDHTPMPSHVNTSCEVKDAKGFFYRRDKQCKKFSLCATVADYLKSEANPTINYFRRMADCREACTNVVECLHQPLEIENGYPILLTEEGTQRRVEEGEKLGYGTRVGFMCQEGYRLMKRECNNSACDQNEAGSNEEQESGCADTMSECVEEMVPLEFEESHRFCHTNGSWNNTRPYCASQCPKPDTLGTVSFSPMKSYYDIGEKIQLVCMDGLEGNAVWTCQENGTWEGQVPTCSPSCAPPPVDNAGPPVEADAHTFTYRCYEGYVLLQGNDTLRCNNGQLEGEPPVCTRVAMRTVDNLVVPKRNGMYHYDLRRGSVESELLCELEGLEEEDYNTSWTLPRKPNGEIPPAVTKHGKSLIFHTAYPEQSGVYECHIAGLTGTLAVQYNHTAVVSKPLVVYFYPNDTMRLTPGDNLLVYTLISGTQPLRVNWQHNGSKMMNYRTEHYIIQNFTDDETTFCTLNFTAVVEGNQGVYNIMASNSGGRIMSTEMAQLVIDQQAEYPHRYKRGTAHRVCTDPKKVVLVGDVRRTGRTESGLQTIRLRVDRVLRGDARGISRRTVEVRIFSGADTSRLRRGQRVIVSGIPHKGRIVYMIDTPIEDYSQTLENAIRDC